QQHESAATTQISSQSTNHAHAASNDNAGPSKVSLPGDARASISSGGVGRINRISNAGDVDGDGTNDLLVSAQPDGGAGSAFVVSGSQDAKSVNLAQLSDAGFEIKGASDAWSVGDVNGDGRADVLVDVPSAATSKLFVVFGPE